MSGDPYTRRQMDAARTRRDAGDKGERDPREGTESPQALEPRQVTDPRIDALHAEATQSVGYAANTPALSELDVAWTKPAQPKTPAATKDPWNYWVFRTSANANVNRSRAHRRASRSIPSTRIRESTGAAYWPANPAH